MVGPTLDHLMQLTSESVNSAGLAPLGAHEFRRFIGTLFLSSSFNLCVEDMFSVMDTLTGGEAMNLPRFKEILRHLRGTDPLFRDGSTGQWNDQRNLLGQMHPLEKMVFERSLHYFFDPDYSSLAYDDEMLGSKASDVEVRSLSDRKAAGEGSIIDCICDTYFEEALHNNKPDL